MSRYNEAKVFVGNLRRDVAKEDLQPLFQDHGDVLNVWVAKNPPGFAFITFRDENEASKAVEKLHGYQADFCESNGQGMRVEISTGGGARKGKPRDDSRDRGFRKFMKKSSRSRSRDRRDRSRGRKRDRSDSRGRRDSRRRDRGRDRRR